MGRGDEDEGDLRVRRYGSLCLSLTRICSDDTVRMCRDISGRGMGVWGGLRFTGEVEPVAAVWSREVEVEVEKWRVEVEVENQTAKTAKTAETPQPSQLVQLLGLSDGESGSRCR